MRAYPSSNKTTEDFRMKKLSSLMIAVFIAMAFQSVHSFNQGDLVKAKKGERNLEKADLSYADLRGANLSQVNLTQANLTYAKLARANLSGANLNGANLLSADLTNTNFSNATLIGVNFTGANLTNTNFLKARIGTFWKELITKSGARNKNTIDWAGY